jgi:O-antigen/teichoic acid export membrane protein
VGVDDRAVGLEAERPAVEERDGEAGLDDGLALSLSAAMGSVAGLLGWVVSTRLIAPSEIGKAAEVVAAILMIGGVAQLNLSVGMLRWIPAAGRFTSRLTWAGMLTVIPIGAVAALVFAIVLPSIAATTAGGLPWWVGAVLFVAATAGWTVFVAHDTLLVAMGKPWWAVWRNGLFGVVRLGMMIVLGLVGLGAQGIVLSWVLPIVVWIVVGSLVLAAMTRAVSRRARDGVLPGWRPAAAFLGPTSVAELGPALLYNVVTVIVTERFGSATGALFFMAWQAVTVVDVSATFFMKSLIVGVAREPGRTAQLAAATRRRLLVIFLPLLALGCLLAGPALGLVFGPEYAAAADVLRLLLVGLAFRLIVLIELGIRQALGRALAYARLQLLSCVTVVVAVAVVPVGTSDVGALAPVAVAYIAVQLACAVAALRANQPHAAHAVTA